jgi:hypothetical protein
MNLMHRKSPIRQQAGFILEMLAELRLEFRRREAWPAPTLVSREKTLMSLWRDRPPTVFRDAAIDRDIEILFKSAFTCAHLGKCAVAALEMHRAYLLVCCVLARRDPPGESQRHHVG